MVKCQLFAGGWKLDWFCLNLRSTEWFKQENPEICYVDYVYVFQSRCQASERFENSSFYSLVMPGKSHSPFQCTSLLNTEMLHTISCNNVLSENLLHFHCHLLVFLFLANSAQVPVGCGKPNWQCWIIVFIAVRPPKIYCTTYFAVNVTSKNSNALQRRVPQSFEAVQSHLTCQNLCFTRPANPTL